MTFKICVSQTPSHERSDIFVECTCVYLSSPYFIDHKCMDFHIQTVQGVHSIKFEWIREAVDMFNLKLVVFVTWLQNSLIPLSPSMKLLKKSASFCKCPETTNLKHKSLLKGSSLLLDRVHIYDKLAKIISYLKINICTGIW